MPSPITGSDLEQRFASAFTAADTSRLAGLTQAQRIHGARSATLERERGRIVTKYGATSPQALEAARRLAVEQALVSQLIADAMRAAVAPFDVAGDAAVIHGFVMQADFTGLAEAQVSAVGDKGVSVGRGDTNTRGYFKISFGIGGQGRGRGPAGGPGGVQPGNTVRLEVSQNSKVLVRDDQDLALEGGRAVYREIVLSAPGSGRSVVSAAGAPPPSD